MSTVKHPVQVAAIFLWIGFVCAISFLEAWLKFQAPGITVALGLGIGRLVFNALNKIEWVFALVILACWLPEIRKTASTRQGVLYLVPVTLLFVQSIWLLPALDLRADLQIQGAPVPPSNLHYYYVGMELIKVSCLFFSGALLFRKPGTSGRHPADYNYFNH